jgi:hypothetical protein
MGRTPLPITMLNIQSEGSFLCPVCGWSGTFTGHSYELNFGGCAGTGICACCHFEPGFDDDPGASKDAKPTIMESIRYYRRA